MGTGAPTTTPKRCTSTSTTPSTTTSFTRTRASRRCSVSPPRRPAEEVKRYGVRRAFGGACGYVGVRHRRPEPRGGRGGVRVRLRCPLGAVRRGEPGGVEHVFFF